MEWSNVVSAASLKKKTRAFAATAAAGFSMFLILVLALHLLQPELNPTERFISEYALGAYRPLLEFAFIGNLIGCLAFTLALYHAYPPPERSWVCLVGSGVAALTVLTNFLPTDPYGKAVTLGGHIHNLGAFVGAIAILVVMAVLTIRLSRAGRMRGAYRLLIIPPLVAPLFFIVMLMTFQQWPGWVGLGQRLYALLIMAWLIGVSIGLKTGALVSSQS